MYMALGLRVGISGYFFYLLIKFVRCKKANNWTKSHVGIKFGFSIIEDLEKSSLSDFSAKHVFCENAEKKPQCAVKMPARKCYKNCLLYFKTELCIFRIF